MPAGPSPRSGRPAAEPPPRLWSGGSTFTHWTERCARKARSGRRSSALYRRRPGSRDPTTRFLPQRLRVAPGGDGVAGPGPTGSPSRSRRRSPPHPPRRPSQSARRARPGGGGDADRPAPRRARKSTSRGPRMSPRRPPRPRRLPRLDPLLRPRRVERTAAGLEAYSAASAAPSRARPDPLERLQVLDHPARQLGRG